MSDTRLVFDLADALDGLRNALLRHGINPIDLRLQMDPPTYDAFLAIAAKQNDQWLLKIQHGIKPQSTSISGVQLSAIKEGYESQGFKTG